jgi:flagellar biogenesis protein FliO
MTRGRAQCIALLLGVTIAALPACAEASGDATGRRTGSQDTGSRRVRSGDDETLVTDGNDDGFWPWVRTLLALAAVVGLVLLARWLFRGAAGRGGRPAGRRASPLQVVARTGLSGRHQLFLVRLGERLVLVGAGPQGLATLSEVTDPAERDRLLEALGATPRTDKTAEDPKQESAT